MNVSWALVISALLIGSALLALADQTSGKSSILTIFAVVGFTLAIALSMLRLVMTFRKL